MSLESSVVLACLVAVSLCQQDGHQISEFQPKLALGSASADDMQEYKRAPAMGFQGVRGKKDDALTSLIDDDFTGIEEFKRAPVVGFQGMRGKKAPQMGFSAMRGKKEDYTMGGYWGANDEDLHLMSPNGLSYFYDTRGKKAPSGFLGMRGKKVPSAFYALRGKKAPSGFMGVRGKKDGMANEEVDALVQMIKESAARQEMEEMMGSRVKRSALPAEQSYQLPSDFDIV
ncbi:Hypothetical protein NTJ_11965 [Nesidiocoris tenuis]|uniref:Tachykinin n=1 Tax=Nesidiocoris tenuis TaxID=355587 RepID=A0ABN7B7K9_9HEMI|nr:Hypothetical protein NTJ_11965 [Nesidiocoris tenuis]